MLKRFRSLKKGLQEMIISDEWSFYKKDNVDSGQFVKETLLTNNWWMKVDYKLAFTAPIYDVLKIIDTNMASLHLVYGMWDSMIENVKKVIYQHEMKIEAEYSSFFKVVEYCSHEWLNEDSKRLAPRPDHEITQERKKGFMRYFDDADIRTHVNIQFANFSDGREDFNDVDSLRDRSKMDAKSWWIVHGNHAPTLQKITLKLLGQPCSSSSCERNWSTYSFIHSLKRNKMTPKRVEDLVFIHSNLRLLSRNSSKYKEEETKLWDIPGDDFSLDEN
uniref:HAT C-terminal dimerisation domain-containing protein n=2 Tax=Phaseolus vulgaris TaxID=3885 RepID=V7CUJ6_PHAVU|nr:hypothetical protein PHAVU_001G102800g [Phaseolus vulgaris]ESW33837.1 hypothetical protein PHAVU_001G102800g [Phaseolus vulgaris]